MWLTFPKTILPFSVWGGVFPKLKCRDFIVAIGTEWYIKRKEEPFPWRSRVVYLWSLAKRAGGSVCFKHGIPAENSLRQGVGHLDTPIQTFRSSFAKYHTDVHIVNTSSLFLHGGQQLGRQYRWPSQQVLCGPLNGSTLGPGKELLVCYSQLLPSPGWTFSFSSCLRSVLKAILELFNCLGWTFTDFTQSLNGSVCGGWWPNISIPLEWQ